MNWFFFVFHVNFEFYIGVLFVNFYLIVCEIYYSAFGLVKNKVVHVELSPLATNMGNDVGSLAVLPLLHRIITMTFGLLRSL